MDFPQWRNHIEFMADQVGQWAVLCNGYGYPIMDLPLPRVLSAPEQALQPAALSMELVNTGPDTAFYADLVGDSLAKLNRDGGLAVNALPPRIIVIQRGTKRSAYLLVYPEVSGAQAPSTLKLEAVELKDLAKWWPAPSIPVEWKGSFDIWHQDAASEYQRPRDLCRIQMAQKADGYTYEKQPAETILRKLYQDSFDAVNRVMGWENSYHMVVDFSPSGIPSPEAVLTVTDDLLWETGLELAEKAGVNINCDLWWPGDPPVQTRNGLMEWGRPMAVWKIVQRKGVV